MDFKNTYADSARAESYAQLEFANTYYLAYRDVPEIVREHVSGRHALDFGCGTGRSTRFLRSLGFITTGVDIASEMVAKARELDAHGDYRLLREGDFTPLGGERFDLVLSMFTFDNIPGRETKLRIFRALRGLLKPSGKLVSVVSSPEIYVNEWASFSTKDFPENRSARAGDIVRIVTTDFPDHRPTEDILFTDEAYRELYKEVGLSVVAIHKPLAHGDEPYTWVNETRIAPWVIHVLAR
jgi:SAM-dependent methyltransferase